ncbi:hypothetical protein KIL84_011559 [Mauremys mutica]|uniref:Uncharacterized protein n=1 Tax=Mauremys mutica TaxID=74926 RepID=A0A9D3XDY7_9SAUR|nr:hypothetical protein KIL84_011559 [Mauremys mutica]
MEDIDIEIAGQVPKYSTNVDVDDRYTNKLGEAKNLGIKKAIASKLSFGFLYLIINGWYGLGFWYGTTLILDENTGYLIGTVLAVFFCVTFSSYCLGTAAPHCETFSIARGAAFKVFKIIDQITVDGHDIKSLNLRRYREFIGVVSQEPVLFGTTIRNNIRYGREDVTDEEIENAAKEANAYDFIMEFPDASKGRTTLVIAHRLSTIRTANVIVAIADGAVAEVGTHSELMEKKGLYYSLATAQSIKTEDHEESTETIILKDHEEVFPINGLISKRASLKHVPQKKAEEEAAPEEEHLPKVSFLKLFRINKSEWPFIALGTLTAVISGAFHPIFSIIFAKIITIFSIKDDWERIRHEANIFSITFAVIGGVCFITWFLQFAYADWLDIILMIIGLIAAVANGTGLPLTIVVIGEMTNSFEMIGQAGNMSSVNLSAVTNSSSTCPAMPGLDIEAEMTRFAFYYVGIGFAVVILSTIQVWTFLTSAARQTARIRQKFFFAILHQEMAWFDTSQIRTLNTQLTDDINTIHEGIGDKFCISVQFLATFLTGIVIGFIYGWKMTLVMLSVSPLLTAAAAIGSIFLASFTTKELTAYARAGAVAEEILTSIRTVVAFNGQMKALTKYDVNLENARKAGVKKSITTYTSFGFTEFIFFGAFALAFWYGTKLTVEEKENYDIGRVVIVLLSVVRSTFFLGQGSLHFESVASARGAAYEVYKVISKILKGLNLKVQSGKTIALVGSSGCGKSTAIQLLQRFYDPVQGEITLDGQDIRTLNIKWLRERIGLVSQEPILFATTIAENIRCGREDITDSEIEKAAKEANAFDFISRLPEKFNTMVGERGAQLSGGQKQRIAIARALARNPRILLLDEATSALDTQSESVVQAALDKAFEETDPEKRSKNTTLLSLMFLVLAVISLVTHIIQGFMFGKSGEVLTKRLRSLSFKALLQQEIGWYDDPKNAIGVLLTRLATDTSQVKGIVQKALDDARKGRTCIIIAHCLTTIQNADVIAVIHNGKVVEQGTHSQLLAKEGHYYALVNAQVSH